MRTSLLSACLLGALLWTAPVSAGLFCQSAAECDDADTCTLNLCVNGTCSNPDRPPGTACDDDSNDCTRDVCALDGGGGVSCQHQPVPFGSPCDDDGNDCTFDRCEPNFEGQLVCAHPPVQFGSPCMDEGNPCTIDRCGLPPAGGPIACLHDPIPPGSPCESDSNSCTMDLCQLGASGIQCAHNPVPPGTRCDDDSNDCTFDACGFPPSSGGLTCLHTPLPPGAVCDDDSPCTQIDSCDPFGECVGTSPVLDCRQAAGASITIRNNELSSRDLVDFKWSKGAAVEPFELGDPRATTDYTLCLFDGNGRLKLSASVPAGGQCGDNDCWKASNKGYQYADKLRLADGIAKVKLSSGAVEKSSAQVRGQGRFLSLPTLPLAGGTTRVQVINDDTDVCFEALFGTPKANTEKKFQAKNP